MELWIIQLLGLLALFNYVEAQKLTNYTVDGPGVRSASSELESRVNGSNDYGGSHAAITGDDWVSIPFEGVAVYLITLYRVPTPLFCWVRMDGGEPSLINMTPSQVYRAESAVFWKATGLSNEMHEIEVTSDATNYCYVDAYIYTSQAGTPVSSLSSSPSTVALALAVSASIMCILLLVFLLIILHKRKKESLQVHLVPFANADDTPKPEKEGTDKPRAKPSAWPVMTKSALPITRERPVSVDPLAIGQLGRTTLHPVVDHNLAPNEPNSAPPNANPGSNGLLSHSHRAPAAKRRILSAPVGRRWSEQLLGNSQQVPPLRRLPIANNSRMEGSEPPPSYFPAKPFIGPPGVPSRESDL